MSKETFRGLKEGKTLNPGERHDCQECGAVTIGHVEGLGYLGEQGMPSDERHRKVVSVNVGLCHNLVDSDQCPAQ